MTRRRSALVLPACQAQSVEENQLRKRPALMSKLFQLRKLNFYQPWLRLMYFELIFCKFCLPCLVLRGRLTYLPSLAQFNLLATCWLFCWELVGG